MPDAYIPIYRKHRASGQAIVTLSGRDYYLGPYGTAVSRAEYDRVVGEWMAAGRWVTNAGLAVAELCEKYLEHAKIHYVKNGKRTSEYALVCRAIRATRTLYARHPAGEFGPLALKAVRQSLIGEKLARTTINSYI